MSDVRGSVVDYPAVPGEAVAEYVMAATAYLCEPAGGREGLVAVIEARVPPGPQRDRWLAVVPGGDADGVAATGDRTSSPGGPGPASPQPTHDVGLFLTILDHMHALGKMEAYTRFRLRKELFPGSGSPFYRDLAAEIAHGPAHIFAGAEGRLAHVLRGTDLRITTAEVGDGVEMVITGLAGSPGFHEYLVQNHLILLERFGWFPKAIYLENGARAVVRYTWD